VYKHEQNIKRKYDNKPKDYKPTITSDMSVPSPIHTESQYSVKQNIDLDGVS